MNETFISKLNEGARIQAARVFREAYVSSVYLIILTFWEEGIRLCFVLSAPLLAFAVLFFLHDVTQIWRKSQVLCKYNSEAVHAQIMSKKRSSVNVVINIRDSKIKIKASERTLTV